MPMRKESKDNASVDLSLSTGVGIGNKVGLFPSCLLWTLL